MPIITGSGRRSGSMPVRLAAGIISGLLGVRRVSGRGAPCRPQHFGQLGPQLLVLLDQPVELGLDLIEEGIDFFLVVARPEPGRAELLVPHIRGRQWHLVSLARLELLSLVWTYLHTLPISRGTTWSNTKPP